MAFEIDAPGLYVALDIAPTLALAALAALFALAALALWGRR